MSVTTAIMSLREKVNEDKFWHCVVLCSIYLANVYCYIKQILHKPADAQGLFNSSFKSFQHWIKPGASTALLVLPAVQSWPWSKCLFSSGIKFPVLSVIPSHTLTPYFLEKRMLKHYMHRSCQIIVRYIYSPSSSSTGNYDCEWDSSARV